MSKEHVLSSLAQAARAATVAALLLAYAFRLAGLI